MQRFSQRKAYPRWTRALSILVLALAIAWTPRFVSADGRMDSRAPYSGAGGTVLPNGQSRYVDPAGACNGLTPCYATITAAVAGSAAGDVLYIFPGVYPESVNLSGMAGPGDIALVAVDATGAPAPGGVTVDPGAAGGPGAGRAIYTAANFPGDVAIRGINVTSPNDDGIHLSNTGDVTIDHVTATGAASDGVDIDAGGAVTITDSTADGNGVMDTFDGDGFEIWAGRDVAIARTGANDNAQEGIDVEKSGGDLTLIDCTASENGGEGIDADDIGGGLTMERCTATDNEGGGIELGEVQVNRHVTIKDSTASNNRGDGFFVYSENGTITMDPSTANHNGLDGVDLEANHVIVDAVTANGNARYGFWVTGWTDMTIRDSRADSNREGFFVDNAAYGGVVTVVNCRAADNSDAGLHVDLRGWSNPDGEAVVKGCALARNPTAFRLRDGALTAYANNVADYVTALDNTGGDFYGRHNWWGAYAGAKPAGLDDDSWDGRLGAAVAAWADGAGDASLGDAGLSGGSGTAVIVSHGRGLANAPFGNGVAPHADQMCSPYYDFFTVNGGGLWTATVPVDDTPAGCVANTLNAKKVFWITDEAECSPGDNPACWDLLPPARVSADGQRLRVSDLTAAELGDTPFVAGNSDGGSPTGPAATPTPTPTPTSTPTSTPTPMPTPTGAPAPAQAKTWLPLVTR